MKQQIPVTYVERLPAPEDYMRLREAVGWRNPSEGTVVKGLEGTLYGVCALVNRKVVGMARVIGDGAITFYIQDVVVYPEYQGLGIGNGLMEHVMAYIAAHASESTVVGLMSAAGKEKFYTRFGFTQRPTDRLGCGMTIFWKRKD
jgi:ribosomal protein S18 acetylase RimI-like enzyme